MTSLPDPALPSCSHFLVVEAALGRPEREPPVDQRAGWDVERTDAPVELPGGVGDVIRRTLELELDEVPRTDHPVDRDLDIGQPVHRADLLDGHERAEIQCLEQPAHCLAVVDDGLELVGMGFGHRLDGVEPCEIDRTTVALDANPQPFGNNVRHEEIPVRRVVIGVDLANR